MKKGRLFERVIDWLWKIIQVDGYKYFGSREEREEWAAEKQKEIDDLKRLRRETECPRQQD